jgi:hypothetical protein
MEFTQEDSIPKLLMANFVIKVMMIGCVFIQINETMLKREEFIRILEKKITTNAMFKHLNFGMKGRTIHLVFPFFSSVVMLQKFVQFYYY